MVYDLNRWKYFCPSSYWKVTFDDDFIVANEITAEAILQLDFLEAKECVFNLAGGKIQIDATEFGIEWPSSLISQAATFSAYKNKNTVEVLIGIIPSGAIVFVSPTYEGSISDKKLVERSNLLDLLEEGDEICPTKALIYKTYLLP